ncbi:Atypical kinase COQ8 [Yarrowia sp. B02]|nr:Atypical kinase COQ8 [Yarrowia sp. B02]
MRNYELVGLGRSVANISKKAWDIQKQTINEHLEASSIVGGLKDCLKSTVCQPAPLSTANGTIPRDPPAQTGPAGLTPGKPNGSGSGKMVFDPFNNKRPTINGNPVDPAAKRMYSSKGPSIGEEIIGAEVPKDRIIGEKEIRAEMQSSAVPSGRFERLFHYGSLATGLGVGALGEGFRRLTGDNSHAGSLVLTPGNVERLVKSLSQMRGAALKIGQQLSFQDSRVFPPEIQQIFSRVQNSANYMPAEQLHKVLTKELGPGWRDELFSSFEDKPIAAASIGQVNTAVLRDSYEPVAIKIQYPGVADSIDSDLNNLMILMTASSMLPEGLFLDKTVANARVELKWECDYIREAQNLERFAELLADYPDYVVPKVYHEASTDKVLTMERLRGEDIVKGPWDQETKNWIATRIMELCLLEIAKFKFMQTDPNWANFLYNPKTRKLELLDFGASRGYSDQFISDYLNCLRAAVRKDRAACEKYSLELGYLTGLESKAMLNAHIDSMITLGEPFNGENGGGDFNFANQTVTDRVRENIGVMLKERLTPPPEETYGLHRKLSGAFLLCAKLNAEVPCQKLFEDIVGLEDQP